MLTLDERLAEQLDLAPLERAWRDGARSAYPALVLFSGRPDEPFSASAGFMAFGVIPSRALGAVTLW